MAVGILNWSFGSFLFLGTCALDAQTIIGVVNAASFEPRLSPGALAIVQGTNLGTSTSTPVTVGGKAAAVLTASPTQLTIQVPFEVSAGPTMIQAGGSAPFNITLSQYAPALFTANGMGFGTVSGMHSNGNAIDNNNPAFPGETISLLATGLGATVPPLATGAPGPANPPAETAARPTVLYATETAKLLSSVMAPGTVGVYWITVQLTPALVTGGRAIGITIGGVSSGFNVSIPIAAAYMKPAITQVISATGVPGSIQENIQAGSWVSIYGSTFTVITRDWTGEVLGGHLPFFLAGVGVTIDGKQAAVYYISPSQLNVQAPDTTTSGPVQVIVTNNGTASAPFTAQMRTHAPAFFQWGATKYAVTTRFPDNTYIGGPVLGPGWVGAKTGDTLILWGTGFGPTQPQVPAGFTTATAASTATLPAVTMGGVKAVVIGAALSPGLAGVYQVAVQVPDGVAPGDALVKATIGGFSSPDNVFVYLSPSQSAATVLVYVQEAVKEDHQ
jgi:uncharacterized protein (TIGR03437 family)